MNETPLPSIKQLIESRNAINAGAKQIAQVSRKLLVNASKYGLAIIVARAKPSTNPNDPNGDVKRWISLDFKAEDSIEYSLTASVYFGNKGTIYTLKSGRANSVHSASLIHREAPTALSSSSSKLSGICS